MQVFLEFKSLNVPKKQVNCVVKKLLQEAGLIEPENEDTPVPDCEHLEEDDHEDAGEAGETIVASTAAAAVHHPTGP